MEKPKLIRKYLLIALVVLALGSGAFPAQAAEQKLSGDYKYTANFDVQIIFFSGIEDVYIFALPVQNNLFCRIIPEKIGIKLQIADMQSGEDIEQNNSNKRDNMIITDRPEQKPMRAMLMK